MLKWAIKYRLRQIGAAAAAVIAAGLVYYAAVKFIPFASNAGNGSKNIWSEQTSANTPLKKYKIFYVMSYHSPWEWSDSQYNGFKSALKDLDVQYAMMQMDTKRISSEEWKQKISQEIINKIDAWKPDLVTTSDDNAQIYVAKHYVNSEIPFVFCAVNADPCVYGFVGSKNVTGVLEKIHFVATMKLLKKIVPNAKKAAILSDTGEMWPPMIAEMKQQEKDLEDIKIVSYDIVSTFEDFQKKILDYQNKVDAIGFLGVFEFKDKDGNNILLEDVLGWLQNNSKLPDFSFWENRVDLATLCAVTISGYEQGYYAGLMAREILAEGKKPSEIKIIATEKGIPMINLTTAERLGIRPDAETLLSVKVVRGTVAK